MANRKANYGKGMFGWSEIARMWLVRFAGKYLYKIKTYYKGEYAGELVPPSLPPNPSLELTWPVGPQEQPETINYAHILQRKKSEKVLLKDHEIQNNYER